MSDNQKQSALAESELERQIREGLKFSLEQAIARLAGPGAMKGTSPIAPLQQSEFAIQAWLQSHLGRGPLEIVLHRYVAASDLLLHNFDQPLVVLAGYCQRLVNSEYALKEIVREADVEWGRHMGERPLFEKEGTPAHPDDPYTVESVRGTLMQLLEQLAVDVAQQE